MKIWGNNIKIGQGIYYEHDFEIKYSKVTERDTKTFKMPSLILENGDRLFVNNWYYTEKQDIIDNLVESLKEKCKSYVSRLDEDITKLEVKKLEVETKLKNLEKWINR